LISVQLLLVHHHEEREGEGCEVGGATCAVGGNTASPPSPSTRSSPLSPSTPSPHHSTSLHTLTFALRVHAEGGEREEREEREKGELAAGNPRHHTHPTHAHTTFAHGTQTTDGDTETADAHTHTSTPTHAEGSGGAAAAGWGSRSGGGVEERRVMGDQGGQDERESGQLPATRREAHLPLPRTLTPPRVNWRGKVCRLKVYRLLPTAHLPSHTPLIHLNRGFLDGEWVAGVQKGGALCPSRRFTLEPARLALLCVRRQTRPSRQTTARRHPANSPSAPRRGGVTL
jgi:hypothetical protein